MHLIERFGGTPIVFSTIEIVPPTSWDACDKAIDALYMYHGLIFTSTNGVDFFFRRMEDQGTSLQELSPKLIFAVGEKTGNAVESHGLRVTSMPEKFTAQDLARTIQHDDLYGKTFLFPRGDLGDNTLAGNLKTLGAHVDSIVVYQTQKPKENNVDLMKTMLIGGKIDFATFTSPSTFKNFIALFTPEETKKIQDRINIAVIGPVTARLVEETGWGCGIIAPDSTTESLVEAIVEYVQSEQHQTSTPARQSEEHN